MMHCPYCGCECDSSAVGDHAQDCAGYGETRQDGPDEPPEELSDAHTRGDMFDALAYGLSASHGSTIKLRSLGLVDKPLNPNCRVLWTEA